jgi:hypothetical protein
MLVPRAGTRPPVRRAQPARHPRDEIFSEKISTRVRVRPRFEEALRTARKAKAHAPYCRALFTAYEMKRLGPDAAELTAIADHLAAHGPGPGDALQDPALRLRPHRPGKLLLAFSAATGCSSPGKVAGPGCRHHGPGPPAPVGLRCSSSTSSARSRPFATSRTRAGPHRPPPSAAPVFTRQPVLRPAAAPASRARSAQASERPGCLRIRQKSLEHRQVVFAPGLRRRRPTPGY